MRSVIALFACVAASLSAECSAGATAPVAKAMTDAAEGFLSTLDPLRKQKAVRPFDDPARRDWHNIPKPERKGLQLREMTAEQRAACHELLKAGLSDDGYEKAVRIMSLENNLREGEKGVADAPLRDPERYFLTIFGEPDAVGAWGWSFEGHHLSLNFAVKDGEVVGDTPSFWGANPATVLVFIDGGPEKWARTLTPEEQLAFDLVGSLDAAQREKAVIAEKAPADYRNAGQPQPPSGPPQGIAAAELSRDQQATLKSLIDTYLGHLEPAVAEARLEELNGAGFDQVYFAWSGATKPRVGHSYCVQGPTFILELVNVQSDPQGTPANHIHSVWRSLTHDFGVPAE